MTGKSTTPKEVMSIIVLREAGFTVLAISQKLKLSTRTVNRHLAAHGVKRGTIKQEVIERGREELVSLVTSDKAVINEAARLICDDIAHLNHLRDIMVEASEFLKPTSLVEAALVMRAAAAYSTAIKNTSDVVRRSLNLDKIATESNDLPELVIRELTNEEVDEIRNKPVGVE